MNRKNSDTIFFSLIFIAMLLWAGSWISGRVLSTQGNPFIIIFFRFLLTVIAFLPFLYWKRKEILKLDVSSFLYTLGAAVILCLYNILFLSGLKASLAGKGGVIVTTTNPIFTFLISILLLKQRAGKDQIIGLALGIVGGMILIEPWTWKTGALQDWSNLIFLAAALHWAILTFLSQNAQKKLHPFVFNPLLYFMATIFSFFLMPENWRTTMVHYPVSFWMNVIYLAVGAGAIGAGMYFMAASRLGATKASTMTFIVPILALLLGWLILGEEPQWQTVLGGTISIFAILIINGKIKTRRFQTSG